jgi:hypothetical protein
MCKKKEELKEPVTLKHLDQHLHDMKLGTARYFVFSIGVSVLAIGFALLLRSLTEVSTWWGGLIMGIGLSLMVLVYLSEKCCKKSK